MAADVLLSPDHWLGERLQMPAFTLEIAGRQGDLAAVLAEIPPGPSFVTARTQSHDLASVRVLEQLGFALVDVAITLECERRTLIGVDADLATLRMAEPADADAVAAVAAGALTRSRFHLDPRISPVDAAAVKADWVRGYFDGARGAWMVVAGRPGSPYGFLLLLDAGEHLVVDLIAVAEGHRGAGIGETMVRGAAVCCGEAPRVRVGTQAANVGAMRFYERLGFVTTSTELVLHRHGAP